MLLTGTLDWLTTVIGIFFFGAVESNPFMAGFTSNSLFIFTFVKLSTTLVVAYLFHRADKTLRLEMYKEGGSFKFARVALKVAYIISTSLLVAAVLNNLIIVARAL
jgi:hypothetical protein